MLNAHQREKRPAQVRQALLMETACIAIHEGLRAVTLQAVADAAGVTKGGLLHHFQSKQALLDALFDGELETYEARLTEEIADKPHTYGVFTRAYIEVSLADGWAGTDYGPNTLATVMIGDPRMRERWACWLNGILKTYADTDDDERLHLARFAADGYWLADMCQLEKPNKGAMREQLLAMTYDCASAEETSVHKSRELSV